MQISQIDPELTILIPVLNVLGAALKRSILPDRYIPLALGATGILLALLWYFARYPAESISMKLYSGIIQGILSAGMSVYAHQVVKQMKCKTKDQGRKNMNKQ